MTRIGILAGGGRLPIAIAESVLARGGSAHIVAIEGEADAEIARLPHTWVGWGQVGRMVATLRREADAMVIAGSVRRPNLWKLRPDWGFVASVPKILEMMVGGDDSVLSRVVRFFEAKGIEVLGAHQVAPELLAPAGPAGALALDAQGHADAQLGLAVLSALGPLDAGQAVVVAGGRVLAIEGAEGTDAMLRRAAALREAGASRVRSGVLAKGPKPGQELRVDMPTIGPRTVALAADAALAGVAVDAGTTLLLDRAEAVAAADARGIAIEGLPKGQLPQRAAGSPISSNAGVPTVAGHGAVLIAPSAVCSVPSPPTGEEKDGRDDRASEVGNPPLPSRSPQASGRVPLRIVGRLRPNLRDEADIAKGLAAAACLAPFGAGEGVVVARAYILAITGADTVRDVTIRTRALRQWGVGTRRRVGVLAMRASPAAWNASAMGELLEEAAASGLAGIVVTGAPAALADLASSGAAADRHGLFLAITDDHGESHD